MSRKFIVIHIKGLKNTVELLLKKSQKTLDNIYEIVNTTILPRKIITPDER